MIQDIRLKWLIAIVALALPVAAAQAATIQTVSVGNAGNAGEQSRLANGDTTYYGGVSHDYNIGTYEVTAGQYAEFLNAVAATDTYGLYNTSMDSHPWGCQITQLGTSGNYTYDFSGRPTGTAADWVNRPVNVVSWGDSARFANWLHNGQPTGAQGLGTTEDGAYYLNGATSNSALLAVSREADWKWAIPTENEWYKAAYHKNDGVTDNYYLFPTSTDSPSSNELIGPDPGNNATFRIGSDYTIDSPYYRTEVGAHENSESPYGTFDQGGNVFEWNEDLDGPYRRLRGGSFSFNIANLQPSFFGFNSPAVESVILGFRVASSAVVPEPGSLAMLAGLAVMGLIWFRRRK